MCVSSFFQSCLHLSCGVSGCLWHNPAIMNLNFFLVLGVLDIPYCHSLLETLTVYPEGLRYSEWFACRKFCVGFQISKIFKDVYIECGGRDTKVNYCFSFLGGNFTRLFFYQSSQWNIVCLVYLVFSRTLLFHFSAYVGFCFGSLLILTSYKFWFHTVL